MTKGSQVQKRDKAAELEAVRAQTGTYQQPSDPAGTSSLPPAATVGLLMLFLMVSAAAIKAIPDTPDARPDTCPAPDAPIKGLNVTGIPVLMENLVHGIERSMPKILPCIDSLPGMNNTFFNKQKVKPDSSTPEHQGPKLQSRKTGRAGSRVPSRAITADDIARIKDCQKAMPGDRQRPELATHIAEFSTSGQSSSACPFSQPATPSTPASRIIAVHDAPPADPDAPVCFSSDGIESWLNGLRPEEGNFWKGILIFSFNFVNGRFTRCADVKALEKNEHAGSLGLFTDKKQYDRERRKLIPAGTFDAEQFENLRGFAREFQGTDEVFTAETLTRFADMLDQSFPPEPGSARDTSSWIPFWGSFKKKAQTGAAAASRDQLIEASFPTKKPLMATYVTMENGQEVTKTVPCIQASMLRLFLENTPLYFATARDAISAPDEIPESFPASSVPEPTDTQPGFGV